MIITDRIGSTVTVDASRFSRDVDAMYEAAARECVRAVVKYGEGFGAFIRPQSVWVTRGSGSLPMHVQVRAEWSPDPAEGVELRRGPLDGQIAAVSGRDSAGRPAPVLKFPQLQNIEEHATEATVTTDEVIYGLVGIDSEHDRWVYVHRP